MSRLLEGRAFAVIMLVLVVLLAAGTAVTAIIIASQADQISENAVEITDELAPTDRELEAIGLLGSTERISGRIADAVQPLDGQLDRVVSETRSIDATVNRIAAIAIDVRTRVERLTRLAAAVAGEVDTIEGRVSAIADNAEMIVREFGAILRVARSIDGGVRGINVRAGRAIARADGIERDLSAVLVHVGRAPHQPSGDQTIAGHAKSIDCSPLLEPEPYCAR